MSWQKGQKCESKRYLRALVEYRLEQADESLKAAETLLKEGLLGSAVNRAYYAMFYSVLALLAIDARSS